MVDSRTRWLYRQFRGKTGWVGRDALASFNLAKAYRAAEEAGCEWVWEDDPDGYPEDGLCTCGCSARIETCEWVMLRGPEGEHFGSIGAIWDADSHFRMYMEAQLALEALDAIQTCYQI